MNNEKINAQHLVTEVARKTGDTKKDTDLFLREFIAVIEEALYKDKIVKVKGLGTFKLVWNASRKSVNVQTGEEIEIAGHHKVNFTAENELKDFVNEPYAHLETVILDGGDEKEIETQAEPTSPVTDNRPDPIKNLSLQAQEIASLISELNLSSREVKQEEPVKEHVILPVVTEPEQSADTSEKQEVENKNEEPTVTAVTDTEQEQNVDAVEKTAEIEIKQEVPEEPTIKEPADTEQEKNVNVAEKSAEVENILAALKKTADTTGTTEPEPEEVVKEPDTDKEPEKNEPVIILPVSELGSNADNESDEAVVTPEENQQTVLQQEDVSLTEPEKEYTETYTTQPEETAEQPEEQTPVTEIVYTSAPEAESQPAENSEEVLTQEEPISATETNNISEEEQQLPDADVAAQETETEEQPEEPKKSKRVLRFIVDILALGAIVFLLVQLVFSCFYNPDCGCYELIMKKERAAAIKQDDQQIRIIEPLEEEKRVTEPILYYDDPSTGEQVDYRTLIIPPKFNPRDYKMSYVKVKSGDYLANYAEDHYGDARFWPYVFLANRDILPNPNSLRVGQRIKVPQLPKEMIDKDDLEALLKAKYIAEHLDEY